MTSKNYSRDYASVENNSKPFDDIYSSKIVNPSVESNIVDTRLNKTVNVIDNNYKKIKSLSGDYITPNQFKHNNMVPYFGSHAPTSNDENANSTVMETFTGVSGNKMEYPKKQEQSSKIYPTKHTSNK